MVRVAILGASGYTALESIKILLGHPQAEISALCSRQAERPHIAELFGSLAGRLDLRCEPYDVDAVAAKADCVLSALPHTASMAVVPELLQRGLKVVDFSADYRLTDPGVYERWYDAPHTDPEHIAEAVYGLPELYRERLKAARLVANPGCYPTGAILGLAPFVVGGHVEPRGIIVDSKSGVSGAGRTPKLITHFPECNESVSAYGVGTHRHTPEIGQVLSDAAGVPVDVTFTPHLVPMDRGILTTIYARPTRELAQADLIEIQREFYRDEPFVVVTEHLPGTKDVATTNLTHATARRNGPWIVIVTAIDNLIKGAAGAAVQNMNLICGLPETAGLL